MRYSLEVLIDGVWRPLDLGDAPAMNYQINSLSELKDRQASYSQAIKLPKTSNNCRVLGLPDIFELPQTRPYEPVPCALSVDGADISGGKAVLCVDKIDEYINCQIVSGIVDLFSQMESFDMNDPAYDYVWDISHIGDTATAGGRPIKTLLATWDKGYENATSVLTGNNTSQYYIPSLPFKDVAFYILNKLGYGVDTDLSTDPMADINNDYITSTGWASGEITTRYAANASNGLQSGNMAFIQSMFNVTSPNGLWRPTVITPNVGLKGPTTARAQAYNSPGNVTIKTVSGSAVAVPLTAYARSRIIVYLYIGKILSDGSTLQRLSFQDRNVVQNYGDAAKSVNFDDLKDIDLGIGETLVVAMWSRGDLVTSLAYGNIPWSLTSSVAITEIHNDKPVLGDTINLLSGTSFSSAQDLFKAFLQTYGLTIDIDHANKIVKIYSLNIWYDRISRGEFLDWSDKLIIDDANNYSFRLPGYAQSNIIALKENSDDGVTDIGSFSVNDKTLESEKTLLTLPFESGVNSQVNVAIQSSLPRAITVANIPAYAIGEEGERTLEGGESHLIRDTGLTINNVFISQGSLTASHNLRLSSHIPIQSYIREYYSRLANNILINSRKLELMLNLDSVDIETLDMFTPVYIDYFKSFFYISKINNFIAGTTTKVELIRL